MDENNILRVKDINGLEKEINVIDIINGEYNQTKKQYIIYIMDNDIENIYISELTENEETYVIKNIESKEEHQYIEEQLELLCSE